METVRTRIDIPLAVPIPVIDASGKEAERGKLVMRRPNTGHAKRLALAIGPQMVKAFFGSTKGLSEEELKELDRREMVQEIIGALVTEDRLDALLEIVADMCGETRETIEELDLVDLLAVGRAVLGFFPALQSFMQGLTQPTSQPSSDGGRPS